MSDGTVGAVGVVWELTEAFADVTWASAFWAVCVGKIFFHIVFMVCESFVIYFIMYSRGSLVDLGG